MDPNIIRDGLRAVAVLASGLIAVAAVIGYAIGRLVR
jgi:hypothetical protein